MLASPTPRHTFCHNIIHFVSQWVRRFLEPVAKLGCTSVWKYVPSLDSYTAVVLSKGPGLGGPTFFQRVHKP